MFDRVFRQAAAGAAATLMLATLTSNALAAPGGTARYVDDDGLAGTNDCNGTLTVPTSIQDAVDAANPGDNVRVCPGTYYGPLDIAKAGLTVSAVTPWTAHLRVDTTTMTDNSELVYMHDAAGMKLRWMTLVIPTQAPCPTGITGVLAHTATNVQIRANHIELEGPVDGDCGIAVGIQLAYSPRGRAVYNRISDFRSNGILDLYSPNSRIAGNTIKFSHAATPAQRAALASAVVVFGSSRAQVAHNFVHGYATTIDDEQLVYGVRVVTIDGSEFGATVRNNHFNDVETAIGMGVNAAVSTTQATVIFNSGSVGIRYGIVLSLADHGDIRRNTFSASVLGISVSDTSTANNIHDNDFVGASNPDCQDQSTGSGTAGTANTWASNLGTGSPAGICGGGSATWHGGDLVTHTQFGWDTLSSWQTDYDTVYNATFGVVEVGIPGTSGFSAQFTSESHITDFFVQAGTPGPLTADLVDPTTTSSARLGGEVLALQMNVDFSNAGLLGGTSSSKFGSLTLCAMSDPSLNGSTVSSVLATANNLLGGGTSAYSIESVTVLAGEINGAFQGGVPTPFAQDHLVDGACPWHDGDLVTHSQWGWDTSSSWQTDYDTVYSSTFSQVDIGIPGASGFSAGFTSATRVTDYLVAAGTPAALDADYINPTTTAAARFGGEVLALQMNVDFSDAGKLGGTSSSTLGSLTLCAMSDASLNGSTVDSVLATANTLLGGGTSSYSIESINDLTAEINGAFEGGVPSTFAQDHLVDGACP